MLLCLFGAICHALPPVLPPDSSTFSSTLHPPNPRYHAHEQVATAKVDTAREVERDHLKFLSDERAAQWPNTIQVALGPFSAQGFALEL